MQAADRARFLQGLLWEQNFYLLKVATGQMRQLTTMKKASGIRQFDVSPDGRQIVFDRYRDNNDVVLIDLSR